MPSLAARLQEECDDNAGAAPARVAAEALTAAARDVQAAAEAGDSALLVGALIRLNEATVAAEQLYDRQISTALILEAGYVQGYEAGRASHRLRSVS